jgi:hypothetical protein
VLLLADDYFLAAHDTITGRCRLSDRTFRLGLASALLGEQVLFGAVRIERGHLDVIDTGQLQDELADKILEEIAAERTVTSLRDWVRYLARDAYDDVGERLVAARLAQRRRSRRLVRTSVVYEPTDVNVAAWPEVRLMTALSERRPLRIPDAALAGIIVATGLAADVFSDISADASQRIHDQLIRIRHPVRESLIELIGQTESAVGDAVLSHRT